MSERKSCRGLPFTHDGVGFHSTGGGDIPSIPFLECYGRAEWSELRLSTL